MRRQRGGALSARWENSMVRSSTPQAADGNKSLGDLVALATKDISQLVRYEISLAKSELRGDVQRIALAAVLGVIAAFVLCLVLVLACIAFAYGLVALGIWKWAAFLIVAGVCVLLAAAAAGIAVLKVRKMSAMRRTRKTVMDDLNMLKRSEDGDAGQQSQISGRTS